MYINILLHPHSISKVDKLTNIYYSNCPKDYRSTNSAPKATHFIACPKSNSGSTVTQTTGEVGPLAVGPKMSQLLLFPLGFKAC